MNSPSGPVNKAVLTGEWERFLPGQVQICFVAVPNSPFSGTCEENKDTGLQEHSLSLCRLPLFLFILFRTQNVHPRVQIWPALSALYFEERAVSFCACHHERISPRLASLDEYDSSAEELEVLHALF